MLSSLRHLDSHRTRPSVQECLEPSQVCARDARQPGPDHPWVQPGNLQLPSQNTAQRETIAPNIYAHMYRPLKSQLSTAAVIISIKCKRCMSSEDNEQSLLTTFWTKKAFLCSNLIYTDIFRHYGELRQSKRQGNLNGKVINYISVLLRWSETSLFEYSFDRVLFWFLAKETQREI